MALTLNVDGKIIENPSETDIAFAFESLDKGTGLFRGPGLSMIILARKEAEEIMATGIHDEGFVLTYQDGNPAYNYNSDIHQPIPVAETIKIFQAYARNEDWGQSKFKWGRFELEVKTSKFLVVVRFRFYNFSNYCNRWYVKTKKNNTDRRRTQGAY
jgi:hypothetical protein